MGADLCGEMRIQHSAELAWGPQILTLMQPAQQQAGQEKVAATTLRNIGRFRGNASLGLLVLLGITPSASTVLADGEPQVQSPSLVTTVDLHRAEVIRFNKPGPAAVSSKIRCGPGGDIYAIYSSTSSREMSSAPITRLSMFSRSVTEYPIPAIAGYEKLMRLSFDVSADGILYALLQAVPQSGSDSKPDPVYLIVKYKDDGQIDSYIAIREELGKQIRPTSLAMFGADNSLVSGTASQKTSDGITSIGVFSAIFDRGGTFRAPVTLMKLATPAESGDSPAPKASSTPVSLASSLLTVGASDYIYVLQDAHLDVVSLSGSVDHEYALRSPADKLSATQMASTGGGYLFVVYDHIATGELDESNKYRSMITVIYSQTGEVTNLYRMPQAEPDFVVPACAASLSDFLFLSSDEQNYLEVVHYVPK